MIFFRRKRNGRFSFFIKKNICSQCHLILYMLWVKAKAYNDAISIEMSPWTWPEFLSVYVRGDKGVFRRNCLSVVSF